MTDAPSESQESETQAEKDGVRRVKYELKEEAEEAIDAYLRRRVKKLLAIAAGVMAVAGGALTLLYDAVVDSVSRQVAADAKRDIDATLAGYEQDVIDSQNDIRRYISDAQSYVLKAVEDAGKLQGALVGMRADFQTLADLEPEQVAQITNLVSGPNREVLLSLGTRLPDYQLIEREVAASKAGLTETRAVLSDQLTQLDETYRQQLNQLRQQTSNPRLQVDALVTTECFSQATCDKPVDLGAFGGKFCALENVRFVEDDLEFADCSVSVSSANRWTLTANIDKYDGGRRVVCAARCVSLAVGAN